MFSAFGVDHGDISKKFRLPGMRPKKPKMGGTSSPSREDPFAAGTRQFTPGKGAVGGARPPLTQPRYQGGSAPRFNGAKQSRPGVNAPGGNTPNPGSFRDLARESWERGRR